jgi:small-conductance mechanosensitive channel
MIARLLFITLLTATDPQTDLDNRAQALRSDIAQTEQSSPRSARAALERQLLTSLERRRDLERARVDATLILAAPKSAAGDAPRTLLEADDLRRDVQQLDESIDAGTRRLELLRADRDAAASRLTRAVAQRRQLEDSGEPDPERLAVAKLDAELAESSTAELDVLQQVVELQQEKDRAQRDALKRRLAGAGKLARLTSAEIAEIDRRIAARTAELQQRLAAAAKLREAAHRELEAQGATASAARSRTLKDRLATGDISIELAREASSNLTIEQAAWQLAIRYWRDGDPSAVADAEERGPIIRASLERRLAFMKTSTEQLLTRLGALDTQIALTPDSPDASEWIAQRSELDQQVRLMQGGILDEHRTLALLERLRDEFDARLSAATMKDRIAIAWFAARKAIGRVWNFEVFSVNQTVEVDGRQTLVPRGVTIAKIVKAPLLLLVGLFLAFKLTALLERYARRRGVDEASARLTRRWTLGLLTAACALSSLAIAGIPLAAFAFIGGAVAIGVGFGMQTLFKNLISGVMVLIERPFRLGDEIQIGELRGSVVDIDLRASVLRDGDGSETLVPNSVMVEQNVRKILSRASEAAQTLSVLVESNADPRAVMDTMRTTAQRHGQLISSHEPVVWLDDFGGQGLQFTLQYWIPALPSSERRRIASDLRLMMFGAFADAGIRFAPPWLDVRRLGGEGRATAAARA